MNPVVKKDILNVLERAISIIRQGQPYLLRELSNNVIHNATIFQDKYSISIAVTIYSLSKIYKFPEQISSHLLMHLESAKAFLEEGSLNKYEKEIKFLINDIIKKDKKTRYYISEVLKRAQIKKASKMYEHGISLGQVADALGVSLWDLMDYVGKTTIHENMGIKSNLKERLAFARSLFGGNK